MNKKIPMAILIIGIIAVSAIVLTNQLAVNQNPNNVVEQNDTDIGTTNSNPYFDVQIQYDSYGELSIVLINKQIDKYLSSKFDIEVNNGNENSADGLHIYLNANCEVRLEPNQTFALDKFSNSELEKAHVFDQKPYVIEAKLVMDSYGTVTKVTELKNVERLSIMNVDFPDVGSISITLKNKGVDPVEISAIRIGSHEDFQNGGNLQNSPLTLQGNETAITKLGFDWVNHKEYWIGTTTSKGNEFNYVTTAP